RAAAANARETRQVSMSGRPWDDLSEMGGLEIDTDATFKYTGILPPSESFRLFALAKREPKAHVWPSLWLNPDGATPQSRRAVAKRGRTFLYLLSRKDSKHERIPH